MYEVLVDKKAFKQHVDQILKSTGPISSEATDSVQAETDNSFNFPASTEESHPLPETVTTSSARYPVRDRRPPDRLSYD